MAMTPEEKNVTDLMHRETELAFTNFERRRAYEWKFSFGIWTALAIFTSFSLKEGYSWDCGSRSGLAVILGLVLLIQVLYQWRIRRGHSVDQSRALHYQSLVDKALGVDVDKTPIGPAVKRLGNNWRVAGWWIAHLGITVTLAGSAMISTFLRPAKAFGEFKCAPRHLCERVSALQPVPREIGASTFKVERVIDGNTFVVTYDGEPTSVRIHGIHAPDANVVGGPAAKEALTKLIGGKTVYLEFVGRQKRDDLRQLAAKVYVVEAYVGAEMVRLGHAVPYVPPAK